MQPCYSLPQLRVLAEAWCEGTGKSVQMLDTLITDATRKRDNRKLFTRMKRYPGAGISARSMEKASAFFLEYWPSGVEWPAEVPRLVDAA